LRSNRGRLFAIEGIDQSGKQTQTRLLANKLRKRERPFSVWSFPDYQTRIGRQLKSYLQGKSTLDMHVVHLLYAANKWEKASAIRLEIDQGKIVLVNRYTPSNLAYGIAHGLPLDWLISLERDLPQPDAVIVLDVPINVSFRRKRHLRDLHEEDIVYLNRVRNAYLSLARKFAWKIVDGSRDRDVVQSEVWNEISKRIGG